MHRDPSVVLLRCLTQRFLFSFSSSFYCRRALSSTPQPPSPLLTLSPAVTAALQARKAVVALESTIITHGMPYPTNLQTARDVEALVVAGGAIPATIAILDGRLCVGLTPAQLEALAKEGPARAIKCSLRDLPWALASNAWGATTVASTLHIAKLANISVFVTGGVGGVHRGAEQTMDVSADLLELGRVPGMAVVCAGVKSILDISKTLEVLETQGVPVISYQTDAFPAFFTPDSGLRAPARVDSPGEVARMLQASIDARLRSSILVAVPNPVPAASAATQAAIEEALREAEVRGLAGKEVTPFLLQRVNEATGGASLKANIELIKNNARVGTAIAVALAEEKEEERRMEGGLMGKGQARGQGASGEWEVSYSSSASSLPASASASRSSPSPSQASPPPPAVVVVGGAVLDLVGSPKPASNDDHNDVKQQVQRLERGTSSPGIIRQKEGGVARNVAEGLTRLGVSTALVSTVAQDPAGAALVASLRALGPLLHLDCSNGNNEVELFYQAPHPAHRTASCLVALDEAGDLVAAVADMDIFTDCLTPQRVVAGLDAAAEAANIAGTSSTGERSSSCHSPSLALVVSDGNLAVPAFRALATACASRGLPLLFEPTSASKALLPLQARVLHLVSLMTPNLRELDVLAKALREEGGGRETGSHHEVVELEEHLIKALRDGSGGVSAEEEVMQLLRPNIDRVLVGMTDGVGVGAADGFQRKSNVEGWKGEKHLLVTLGKHGLVWASVSAAPNANKATKTRRDINIKYLPIPGGQAVEAMADCTGAGDTLVAGIVAALVRAVERGMEGALEMGLAAAIQSVQVNEAVPKHLTWEGLQATVARGRGKEF